MPQFHFAMQTLRFQTAFRNRKEYAETWWALRRAFRQVLAAALMPDHVHLALETDLPQESGARLAWILGGLSRRHHGARIWAPFDPPVAISNPSHLRRQIRYIHLNPCRDGLTRDPLEWEWTTHRDAMGAARPSWIELRGIHPESFHAYVSGDPSAKVEGTAPPRRKSTIVASLEEVRNAVLLATREVALRKAEVTQPSKIFAHLVRQLGYTRVAEQAEFLRVSDRTIWNLARAPLSIMESNQLEAARLVLSDPRLNFVRPEVQARSIDCPGVNFARFEVPGVAVQRSPSGSGM